MVVTRSQKPFFWTQLYRFSEICFLWLLKGTFLITIFIHLLQYVLLGCYVALSWTPTSYINCYGFRLIVTGATSLIFGLNSPSIIDLYLFWFTDPTRPFPELQPSAFIDISSDCYWCHKANLKLYLPPFIELCLFCMLLVATRLFQSSNLLHSLQSGSSRCYRSTVLLVCSNWLHSHVPVLKGNIAKVVAPNKWKFSLQSKNVYSHCGYNPLYLIPGIKKRGLVKWLVYSRFCLSRLTRESGLVSLSSASWLWTGQWMW